MDSSTLPKNSLPAPTRRLHPGLPALALGGFGIGLTEFVIAGLLTDVADALHVSVPTAGALIWGYALAVVVGAFTVTAALSRRPPKTALLVLLTLFVIGNGLTALAPGFGVAMLGRIITALCHGGFFGIGAVVAGDLVSPERKASAIAVMFGGLTLSNMTAYRSARSSASISAGAARSGSSAHSVCWQSPASPRWFPGYRHQHR